MSQPTDHPTHTKPTYRLTHCSACATLQWHRFTGYRCEREIWTCPLGHSRIERVWVKRPAIPLRTKGV